MTSNNVRLARNEPYIGNNVLFSSIRLEGPAETGHVGIPLKPTITVHLTAAPEYRADVRAILSASVATAVLCRRRQDGKFVPVPNTPGVETGPPGSDGTFTFRGLTISEGPGCYAFIVRVHSGHVWGYLANLYSGTITITEAP